MMLQLYINRRVTQIGSKVFRAKNELFQFR